MPNMSAVAFVFAKQGDWHLQKAGGHYFLGGLSAWA
jgi:hypothetical protein